jgi:hypothetical protein
MCLADEAKVEPTHLDCLIQAHHATIQMVPVCPKRKQPFI